MAEIREKRTKKGSNFMSGVLILSLSAVIVKIIGLIYKIPMLRLLGSEGMGYFNSAYEIYTLFCVISTAGLPVAMSVMISSSLSRGDGEDKSIFRVAMRLFLLLGVAGGAIMLGFARPFASFLGSDRALYCIYAIAPTVFFICLSSAYRGYFQGFGRMAPTAISQIIEALGKLVLGLIFAGVALYMGLDTELVAAFAVLGLTLGTAVSALYLMLMKKFKGAGGEGLLEVKREKGIMAELLRTAIPVTLSSAVISMTKLIDMTMILRRMQSVGYSSSAAFSAYGSYTTLAVPLFSLAPALISSIALPLVPALSSAIASGDREGQSDSVFNAMKLTTFISAPVSVGSALFSRPILELIFKGESEAIDTAAPLLTILGFSVTLSCMITVTNAILQAYSRASVPILSMAVGAIVKIAVAYILIGNKDIGIVGAPVSTFLCDLIINLINFAFICRRLPTLPSIDKIFFRPFAAAAVSVVAARAIYNFALTRIEPSGILTLACVGLAGILYLLLAVLLGVFGEKELSRLPFSKRRKAETA